MTCAFILVAGGSGSRLGASLPKAFVDLEGRSLVARSFEVLQMEVRFRQAVVVAPADWCERTERSLRPGIRANLKVSVVAGGERRQDSVRAGLDALAPCEIVLVHDAARPFVRLDEIAACIAVARLHGAATVALPPTDTLKEVDERGQVIRTLDRSRLRSVQTPQAFRFEILRDAHDQALRRGLEATDDAALVEAVGSRVMTVPGHPSNLKITTPEDLAWARWLLRPEHR